VSTTTVAEIMSAPAHFCETTDTLDRAAQIMWQNDCGVVPVVDRRGTTVGMITDRDICMATYTQGKPIWQIPVTAASSLHVWSVRPDDSIEMAQELMKMHRVRRLAVIDRGGNLVGVLSLADIVRWSQASGEARRPFEAERVAATLAEVFRPHFVVRPLSGETNHGNQGGTVP
jgi:predicted transcriptional regulator